MISTNHLTKTQNMGSTSRANMLEDAQCVEQENESRRIRANIACHYDQGGHLADGFQQIRLIRIAHLENWVKLLPPVPRNHARCASKMTWCLGCNIEKNPKLQHMSTSSSLQVGLSTKETPIGRSGAIFKRALPHPTIPAASTASMTANIQSVGQSNQHSILYWHCYSIGGLFCWDTYRRPCVNKRHSIGALCPDT